MPSRVEVSVHKPRPVRQAEDSLELLQRSPCLGRLSSQSQASEAENRINDSRIRNRPVEMLVSSRGEVYRTADPHSAEHLQEYRSNLPTAWLSRSWESCSGNSTWWNSSSPGTVPDYSDQMCTGFTPSTFPSKDLVSKSSRTSIFLLIAFGLAGLLFPDWYKGYESHS